MVKSLENFRRHKCLASHPTLCVACTVATWPTAIYFELQPKSYGNTVFPFKRYPRDAPAGSPVKIAKVPLEVFANDKYKLFHVHTTPTQFGRTLTQRVHTNVAFATRDHWSWLRGKGAIELSKSDNSILSLDGEGSSGAKFYRAV